MMFQARRRTAPGQAKISDMRLAFGIEKDVGRFEVAVQHAALVGVMHGTGYLRLPSVQPGEVAF